METEIRIVEIQSVEEMLLNFHLLVKLTPSLTRETYQQHLQNMIPHNYFQIVALMGDKIVGVSGYWIATKLYCGRYLEIDNFIVDEPYRSQGIGHLLIEKLESIAQTNHCDVIMLDAYLQNTQAHKFYEKHQFAAKGYHFIKKVAPTENSHECLN
ncbi:MAG: GNAT family N-acetyltransferase [Bacteroidetes bacterium]|nr:GNAT family N-acetyltransferase [Bacteroidota bacterium]MBP6316148.1 GNAT family N-acetyltransferase [Chitinophagaceae bacterium]